MARMTVVVYRIIEWFVLEGTFKSALVQPPCRKQGYLQLDQVAYNPVHPDLECSQARGICHLSEQPLPVFYHPRHKKIILSTLILPSFSLKPLSLVLLLQAALKRLSPSFL